jgi:hypothetical protein
MTGESGRNRPAAVFLLIGYFMLLVSECLGLVGDMLRMFETVDSSVPAARTGATVVR